MKNLKKIVVSLMFVLGLCVGTIPVINPVNAMIYISDYAELDETSATVIEYNPNTKFRKFAICGNIKNKYRTIYFTYSPYSSNNQYASLSDQVFSYSFDDDFYYTAVASPIASNASWMGEAFRVAWNYAFGYSFS